MRKPNTLIKLVFAASAMVVLSAHAQTDIKSTASDAYLQDGRGNVARNGNGLCWHTNYWTPADAIAGCDAPLATAAAKPAPTAATPAPAPATATPAAQPAAPAVETNAKVTLSANTFFDFDRAELKPDGKAALDTLVSKLGRKNLEVIIAVGHTDAIGTDAYNQKLSVRRAESVKSYLVKKGVNANYIRTEGKGKSQPVASNDTATGRAQNRRVEIEVVSNTSK